MANDINVVVLVGRLTRDCEVRSTQAGMSICRFSVAVNRRKKSGDTWTDEANFFDVVLMGKSADSLKPYLTKGRQVSVEGELRQSRWEQDGQAHSRIEIMANNVQLLSSPGAQNSSDSGSYGNVQRSNPAPAQQKPVSRPVQAQQPGPEAFDDDVDSVIPF
ncbi:MAG: single-stranded DNA-binding protein [Sphaerochaetaceae bacterium]|nr:single-stranded DNA-binding protein [Sphaerochaetaceae bacterium]